MADVLLQKPRLLTNLLTTMLVVLAVTMAPIAVQPASAIAHGEDTPDGRYGFSVRLAATGIPTSGNGTRDSWCSGALIAPRWVITAGHCFRTADGRRVSRTVAKRNIAVVGRTDLDDQGGHEVDIVAVRQSATADVALAELGTAVTDVQPLRIGTTPPEVGETLRLTGWGLLADKSSTAPNKLQTGQFSVNTVSDSVVGVSGRHPRKDTSACLHDSGAPYFREDPDGQPVLVSVVSTGPSCPHEGEDFSARTDNLNDWIAETIKTKPGSPVRLVTAAAVAIALVVAVIAAALLIRSVLAGRRSPQP